METENDTETASNAPTRDGSGVVDRRFVLRLAYRPWDDRTIRWDHQKPEKRWMAYYNGAEIGGISDHPHDGLHYAWMFASRLRQFPETVEQGKEWIEALFAEWVRRASGDFPQNR